MATLQKYLPPLCWICSKPCSLESCNTDQFGLAVHEDCYVTSLRLRNGSRALQPKAEDTTKH